MNPTHHEGAFYYEIMYCRYEKGIEDVVMMLAGTDL